MLVIGPEDEAAIVDEAGDLGTFVLDKVNGPGVRTISRLFGYPVEWGSDRTYIRTP